MVPVGKGFGLRYLGQSGIFGTLLANSKSPAQAANRRHSSDFPGFASSDESVKALVLNLREGLLWNSGVRAFQVDIQFVTSTFKASISNTPIQPLEQSCNLSLERRTLRPYRFFRLFEFEQFVFMLLKVPHQP